LVVPVTGQYDFRFSGPPGSSFSLDHQRIMEPSNVVTRTSTSLLLTRGPHTIRFSSTLPTPQSHLELLWNSPDALPGSSLQPVRRRYVWDGHPGN
jgi:hypothetical protein